MENILDKIVHKLWMIDHHANEPIHIREIFEKVHLSWLRENLDELEVNSAHIKIENLREFAIATLFKHGWIYKYDPKPKNCLIPVIKNQCEIKGLPVVPEIKNGPEIKMRDYADETLLKNGYDFISPDPENIYNLRDFAEDTLSKNGCVKISTDLEIVCEMGDFAAHTLPKNGSDENIILDTLRDGKSTICDLRDFAADTLAKNGTVANFTPDTLSVPNLNNICSPENMAISVPESSETSICSNSSHGETDHAIFFEKHEILNSANFFKTFSNLHFCSSKFSNNLVFQFDKVMSRNTFSHVHINLGGRGHRFNMTLESRIPRFKNIK
jgi:hypothetical protein